MPEEDPIDFSKDDELVPVVYGRDEDEAEEYRQLLEDHEIEATVGFDALAETPEDTDDRAISRGIPVLVPDSLLDEASEIIADREDTEDFEVEDEFEEDEEEEEDEFSLELDEEELVSGPAGYLDDDDELEDDELFEDDDDDYDAEFDDEEEDFEL